MSVFCRPALSLAVSWMDMPTLLNLRRLNHAVALIVENHLRLNLLSVLSHLVPNPASFLTALDFSSGFVVGSTAIRYILRDSSLPVDGVDVLLPRDHRFGAFLMHLLSAQQGRIAFHRTADQNTPERSRRAVRAVVHVATPQGMVYIYQSIVAEALLPLVVADISCQMVYVNADHFGAGYPNLLFERRALLGEMAHVPAATMTTYLSRGFSLRLFVNQWDDRSDEDLCAAEDYECPAQVRSLSDGGSMRVRFSPLHSRRLRPRVAWRLDVRPCGGFCFAMEERIGRWNILATLY